MFDVKFKLKRSTSNITPLISQKGSVLICCFGQVIFRVKKKPNETRELNSTISKKRSLKLGMHRDKTLLYKRRSAGYVSRTDFKIVLAFNASGKCISWFGV